MTEIDAVKSAIAEAWSGKTHDVPLRGEFTAPTSVRPGGLTDTLITVAAEAAFEHFRGRLERLSRTVQVYALDENYMKLDTLIAYGFLDEGDMLDS